MLRGTGALTHHTGAHAPMAAAHAGRAPTSAVAGGTVRTRPGDAASAQRPRVSASGGKTSAASGGVVTAASRDARVAGLRLALPASPSAVNGGTGARVARNGGGTARARGGGRGTGRTPMVGARNSRRPPRSANSTTRQRRGSGGREGAASLSGSQEVRLKQLHVTPRLVEGGSSARSVRSCYGASTVRAAAHTRVEWQCVHTSHPLCIA